ncbi:hypothetical protein EJ05DRAFT_44202 [Pseudovirgaria hyperparasitica]|uniref:Ubiquitin-like domain-containing protein n=1 Tax=Pseudovirgaria hyperparasitica TaxID=470096 RepID=A0A6A6W2J8_9PEZI|nr:uncharacterized protein EJ05DRAFT_44202 [Pseudovirgaria hyperparasitica]KAF2756803.1 hypothetical protein EJ05DRAFT_44202 [Pseudovirgaria hyperparasitica]
MANNTGAEAAQQQIDLKILTNTSHATLFYPNLPVTTTILDLKTRIQDDLSPNPALDRLRMIYLGRVLLNMQDTLLDIFGADHVKQSREQTIHLVVPDQGRAQTDQANRPPTVPSPLPSTDRNPFRVQQQAQQRPQPQQQQQQPPQRGTHPGVPHVHVHGHHHNIVQGGPPPFPPEFAEMITRQMAAVQNGSVNTGRHPQEVLGGVPVPGFGIDPNNFFQQVIAQQHQQRAAAGTGTGHEQARSVTPNANGSEGAARQNGGHSPIPGEVPGNVHIYREGETPSGARWSMTVDRTIHQFPHHPNEYMGSSPLSRLPSNPFQRPPPTSSSLQHPSALPTVGSPFPTGPQVMRTNSTEESIRRATENMRTIRDDVGGRLEESTPDEVNRLRAILETYESYHARVEQALNYTTPQNPASQFSTSPPPGSLGVQNAARPGSNHQPNTTSRSNGAATASTPRLDHIRTTSEYLPQVFLLRGPDGPHALLLSSSGTYRTGGLSDSFPLDVSTAGPSTRIDSVLDSSMPTSSAGPASGLPVPPQFPAASAPDQANAPRIPQQDQNEAPDAQAAIRQRLEQRLEHLRQQRAQGRNAQNPQNAQNGAGMALAGHIWLAARLLFFLYMFSGGSGWRRPLMMIGAALTIYLFQLGVFNAPVDMLRRHFENLLPLPEERRREEQIRRNAGLTPEQVAERLVQNHNNENVSWMRDQLRIVERALALFVASLWPGLGERMVATREARLRQQREEEEQRTREAETAQQADVDIHADQNPAHEEIPDEPGGGDNSKGKGKGKGKARDDGTEAASSSLDPTPSGSETTSRSTFQSADE